MYPASEGVAVSEGGLEQTFRRQYKADVCSGFENFLENGGLEEHVNGTERFRDAIGLDTSTPMIKECG
jgi:hypothetical protein